MPLSDFCTKGMLGAARVLQVNMVLLCSPWIFVYDGRFGAKHGSRHLTRVACVGTFVSPCCVIPILVSVIWIFIVLYD